MKISKIINPVNSIFNVQTTKLHTLENGNVDVNFSASAIKKAPVKKSASKSVFGAIALLGVFNYLAKNAKEIFDIEKRVKRAYPTFVARVGTGYLKEAYLEDPKLFDALVEPYYIRRSGINLPKYSPAEVLGIIKTKKEDPVLAYNLSRVLEIPRLREKTETLKEPKQVMFLAESLKENPEQVISSAYNRSTLDLFYHMKAVRTNEDLTNKLVGKKNTENKKLTDKEILSIVELYDLEPELVANVVRLRKISEEDISKLVGLYKQDYDKQEILDFIDFLVKYEPNKSNPYKYNSTETLSLLVDDWIADSKSVKDLISRNLPVEDIKELAYYYQLDPKITLQTYNALTLKWSNEKVLKYFENREDAVNFLKNYVNISEFIPAFEKMFGAELSFMQKINLARAYDGNENNFDTIGKIAQLKLLPKNFNLNKLPKLIRFMQENPDKEITKENVLFVIDDNAKLFGLI